MYVAATDSEQTRPSAATAKAYPLTVPAPPFAVPLQFVVHDLQRVANTSTSLTVNFLTFPDMKCGEWLGAAGCGPKLFLLV